MRNKARRRDVAGSAPPGYGKETQRSAASNSSGIGEPVRMKAL